MQCQQPNTDIKCWKRRNADIRQKLNIFQYTQRIKNAVKTAPRCHENNEHRFCFTSDFTRYLFAEFNFEYVLHVCGSSYFCKFSVHIRHKLFGFLTRSIHDLRSRRLLSLLVSDLRLNIPFLIILSSFRCKCCPGVAGPRTKQQQVRSRIGLRKIVYHLKY